MRMVDRKSEDSRRRSSLRRPPVLADSRSAELGEQRLRFGLLLVVAFVQHFLQDLARAFDVAHLLVRLREVELGRRVVPLAVEHRRRRILERRALADRTTGRACRVRAPPAGRANCAGAAGRRLAASPARAACASAPACRRRRAGSRDRTSRLELAGRRPCRRRRRRRQPACRPRRPLPRRPRRRAERVAGRGRRRRRRGGLRGLLELAISAPARMSAGDFGLRAGRRRDRDVLVDLEVERAVSRASRRAPARRLSTARRAGVAAATAASPPRRARGGAPPSANIGLFGIELAAERRPPSARPRPGRCDTE